ncbi:unnamed protein product [Gongylonema pulchrum]|uniref:Uncharacterized protein n=1 Tax=Gongylonema pulchrum TaxID=637853 RepID=A0A183D3B8_9BILA|nr:unnamed protein product [Gongylonema pulchrum]
MYKFDRSAELVIENTLNNIDEDGAAGESEHHRFWGKIFLYQRNSNFHTFCISD